MRMPSIIPAYCIESALVMQIQWNILINLFLITKACNASLDQTVSYHNNTTGNNNNKSLLMSELQSKLGEFDQLKDKEQLSMIQENEQNLATCDSVNEPVDKDFALRQAKMQYQLTEYDTELMKKTQLFQKMLENNMNKHENKIEANMDDLKTRIDALEKEKEDLLDVIRNGEAGAKSKTGAEQRSTRLKQLEAECSELKKQEKDFKRMIKIKEENEKHCERLRNEIQHIKAYIFLLLWLKSRFF